MTDDFLQSYDKQYVFEKLKEAGVTEDYLKNEKLNSTVEEMGSEKVNKALDAINSEYAEYGEAPGDAMRSGKTLRELVQRYSRFLESMG